VAISHASIVVPFLLGTVLALRLYPEAATAGIPFTGFSLFVGVSMSVTAFPVLSRILSDLGLNKTSLGITVLTCAAGR
jgi:Kef-type K+ transport system membrane component KefB